MKLFLIILMLALQATLSSCGSSNDGGGAAPVALANPDAKGQEKAKSYYVSDASQLVPCNAASNGYLVYVKSTKEFMTCDGTSWAAVDIKGKDGAQGPSGPQGSAGVAGSAVPSNAWYDGVSGKTWLVPSLASTYDEKQCAGGGYRMPLGAELTVAIQRGLLAKATTTWAWAEGGADSYCIHATCDNNSKLPGDKTTNQPNSGHYCISN